MPPATFEESSVDESANCLVCANRCLFTAGSFIGMTSFTINCTHQNGAVGTDVRFPQLLGALSLAVTLFSLTCIGLNSFIHFSTQERSIFTDSLCDIIDHIFGANTVIITATYQFRVKRHAASMNSLMILSERGKECGINVMINKNLVQKLRIRNILCCIYALATSSVFQIPINLFCSKPKIEMAKVLNTYAYFVGIFYVMAEITGHHILLSTCHARIKYVLTRRQKPGLPGQDSLLNDLRKLQELHCAVDTNLKETNKVSNPLLIITITGQTLCFLLVLYISLLHFLNKKRILLCGKFATILVLFYEVVLVVFWVWFHIQQLYDTGEDLLSFLYRYPLSKLSHAEIAEVEMLVTTLNIRKPILKASDIFIVGTKLLASVTATVVTYLLVALQFRSSWSRE